MRTFIYSGGVIHPDLITDRPAEGDLCIAADGGYRNAQSMGGRVDVRMQSAGGLALWQRVESRAGHVVFPHDAVRVRHGGDAHEKALAGDRAHCDCVRGWLSAFSGGVCAGGAFRTL